MTKRFGYIATGPRTPDEQEQRRKLNKAGIHRYDIVVDRLPDRSERRDLIEVALRDGDTLVIVSDAILGSGKKDTARTVHTLGKKGVAIEVLGGDPKVYAGKGEAERFGENAVLISRRINAKIVHETTKIGRKEKWHMTEDAEKILRILWHDKRVPLSIVLSVVNDAMGGRQGDVKVTRENLYARLGNRDATDQDVS